MYFRSLFFSALCTVNLLFSQELPETLNTFGIDLVKPLVGSEANAIYSPFSLFTCFSMAASGAEGTTRTAMEKTLCWKNDRIKMARELRALSEKLLEYHELHCANALFAEQDTMFLPSFTTFAEQEYRADLQSLDFSKSNQAIQIINGWIGNETHQKIRDLLQPGDLSASTRLVLVNALYFQGNWQNRFDQKMTQTKPFYLDGRATFDVPLMRQTRRFRYFEDNDVRVAILPFSTTTKTSPSLLIVLPKADLVKNLTPKQLQDWLSLSKPKLLDFQLPRFCLRKRYDLQKALSSLGMGIAFTEEADFSGIDGMRDLYLSKSFHEGFFNLDENGVEAAAATSAVINVTSAGPNQETPLLFIADHPFFFFSSMKKANLCYSLENLETQPFRSVSRPMIYIESFGMSDIGKKRQNNEDVFAILEGCRFYALADGMGGHQAGEVAAKLAIESLCQHIADDQHLRLPISPASLSLRLAEAIQQTNQHVVRASEQREDWSGMGTTLSCLLLHDDLLFFAHVGDSRIYRFRDNLEQITKDHTVRCEKKKGKITRAIGTSPLVEPEIGKVAPLEGDIFLICSDGLTDHLSDPEIERVLLNSAPSLSLICQSLIDEANSRGGHDNITVLALKIEEHQ